MLNRTKYPTLPLQHRTSPLHLLLLRIVSSLRLGLVMQTLRADAARINRLCASHKKLIMNRQQLICFIVPLLLIGLLAGISHGHSNARGRTLAEARMIGDDLIQSNNSARIIHLGPGLKGKLQDMTRSKTTKSLVLFGDDPELGDGKAACRLYLSNSVGHVIGIRLRPGGQDGKYHLLGYWTVQKPRDGASTTNGGS